MYSRSMINRHSPADSAVMTPELSLDDDTLMLGLYSVATVCLSVICRSPVTYVLWLNGASLAEQLKKHIGSGLGNRVAMRPMTSRDPERSVS